MSKEIAIRFEDVSKHFEGSEMDAVSHVSLDIEDGQIVTILGTSGSGKTTLLKMVNRLYEPTSGKIYFFGDAIDTLQVNEYRRKIGYVIQQAGLFPHMTVAQNIAVVPNLLNWNKQKISDRIEELLQMIGLDPAIYKDRYPRQLSGGEQQRVGLARAMAVDPSTMLMDEPFGAIDAITRTGLQDELKRIQHTLNKTILFVTHDIQEAFKLGDRVIIMNSGELQQFDTPFNILYHPANDYVRKLIATNNLYDKLKLLYVREVMEHTQVCDQAHHVSENDDLGRALTCMVKYNLSEVAVENNGSCTGIIRLDKIWDMVRPSLQEECI